MAQTASEGRYGVTKKLLTKLKKLLFVTSVGNGLSIDNGVLSSSNVTHDYSTTEFNTGCKWIDGKDIYQKTFHVTSPVTLGTSNEVKKTYCDISSLNIDSFIKVEGIVKMHIYNNDFTFTEQVPKNECGSIDWGFGFGDLPVTYNDSPCIEVRAGKLVKEFTDVIVTVLYTKNVV